MCVCVCVCVCVLGPCSGCLPCKMFAYITLGKIDKYMLNYIFIRYQNLFQINYFMSFFHLCEHTYTHTHAHRFTHTYTHTHTRVYPCVYIHASSKK